ncbi:hypothetical protein DEI83_14175 [Curtobacterium sp. MCBD17_021]|nr:hypothetical protein DEI83_14175 [Curtobacterium sp. MCBD17_021]
MVALSRAPASLPDGVALISLPEEGFSQENHWFDRFLCTSGPVRRSTAVAAVAAAVAGPDESPAARVAAATPVAAAARRNDFM